jgi:ferredoxin-NADP reductase/predicted pyridoxine 5'-phosphate oxidase superfamily flavin-nucleotide-binding protein
MSARTETRPSPWHPGEITLQRQVGVAERMEEVGRRTLRDHLIEQHRNFYPQLPFVVLGAVDAAGDVWATLRAGKPGFLHAPDPYRLHVAMPREPSDPADAGMADGDAVALLGIELHTRRRNRLNGIVRRDGSAGFDITVAQSFGNCPQYIQLRDFAFVRDPAMPAADAPRPLEALDARAREMIGAADTFFVATYVDREAGERQVDVSHRGGKPGFVRVDVDGVLTIPDFAGNRYFNTLGNIFANPKAGLVFVDFETGDLLQLSGDAEIVLDSPEIAAFQGAERLWRVRPRRIVHRPNALPLRWKFEEDGWSPNALLTGSWANAAQRLEAARLAASWRPFEIVKIVEESSAIRSFHLKPADGAGIVPHQAGQHLPIRVTLPGSVAPVLRTYTLSVAPSDGLYRISVKREGAVSRHLHDALRVGDVIEAQAPAGSFTIDAAEARPAVLLAAGVGITPILAMLRHIVYEGVRTRRIRPTWLFYAARSKAERAFDRELRALAEAAQGEVRLVRVLSDKRDAAPREDFEAFGRVDMALLRASLPFDDYDFYLCGPAGFMQAIYDGLRGLNIADARIHAEAFGPASLQRKRDAGVAEKPMRAVAATPVAVGFAKSGKEARWTPEGGTLLELAEAEGLAPPFSCRNGECGTCKTRILAGAIAYNAPPTAEVAENETLICCARPAAPEDGGGERLVLDL